MSVPHMATTDHLLISSISHNSQWWSITAAENLSELLHRLISP